MPLSLPNVTTAGAMMAVRAHLDQEPDWNLGTLAGRFTAIEASRGEGDASLSLLASLIREVQESGGLATWISLPGSSFFPPDFEYCGVDLRALPVVQVPDTDRAARAADTLIRSGSFALVVVDASLEAVPLARQNRLSGLAHQFSTALVTIRGSKDSRPRGSLVSLRCTMSRRQSGPNSFPCEVRAVKDKRAPAGWTQVAHRFGPPGLC